MCFSPKNEAVPMGKKQSFFLALIWIDTVQLPRADPQHTHRLKWVAAWAQIGFVSFLWGTVLA